MEFKNVNNHRLKWFGTNEIRSLEEVKDKLPFITSFSFGPFAPYNLYHFFHNLWDFYLLEAIIVTTYLYIYLFNFFFFYFFPLLQTAHQSISNNLNHYSDSPFSSFKNTFSPTYFLWLIFMVFTLLLIVLFVKFYAGKHSRKISWNRCEWKSYSVYEKAEKNWNLIGLVCFLLYLFNNVLTLIMLIMCYCLTKSMV